MTSVALENFDAIDPTGYFFPGYPKVPDNKYLNDFKCRAFVLGLDISGTGVRNDFASPDKEKRATDVRHVKEWIEAAARMGAGAARLRRPAARRPYLGPGGGVDGGRVAKVRRARPAARRAHRHPEPRRQPHDGRQALKIVKMVDSEWFGAIVDTGNFLTDDPYKDIAAVAPHAVNWQIKEYMGGKDGKVKTDLKKVVRIARDSSYRGYLPIETLSTAGEDYDPHARVRQVLKELRAAIQEAK